MYKGQRGLGREQRSYRYRTGVGPPGQDVRDVGGRGRTLIPKKESGGGRDPEQRVVMETVSKDSQCTNAPSCHPIPGGTTGEEEVTRTRDN